MISVARSGSPNRFITLTVNPNWFNSPADRAARLSKAWRLTVAAFRHRWPAVESEYLAVFEATALGEPHLHIVWRGGYIPQAWLAGQLRKRMGAPIVDVRRVRGRDQVSRYVAKYISKRSIKFGSCKRYWMSAKYVAASPSAARRAMRGGAVYGQWRSTLRNLIDLIWAAGLSFTLYGHELLEFQLPQGVHHPPGFWNVGGELIAVT